MACQAETATMPSQARSSLARIEVESQSIPSHWPSRRERVGEDEVEDVTDDEDRQHVWDEEEAPECRLELDLGIQQHGKAQGQYVDNNGSGDGEQEREAVGGEDPVVLEEAEVVFEPDEVPLPVAGVVREAEEDSG